MTNLEGKTAIVTGSSRGIGRAIAVRLAKEERACRCLARRKTDGARSCASERRESRIACARPAGSRCRQPLVEFALKAFGRSTSLSTMREPHVAALSSS